MGYWQKMTRNTSEALPLLQQQHAKHTGSETKDDNNNDSYQIDNNNNSSEYQQIHQNGTNTTTSPSAAAGAGNASNHDDDIDDDNQREESDQISNVWNDLQQRRQRTTTISTTSQFNNNDNILTGPLMQPPLPPPPPPPPPPTERNKWKALFFGQCIALIATSQNAASFTLEYGMGKVFPMFLMFFTYILLSLHLVVCHRRDNSTSTSDGIPTTTNTSSTATTTEHDNEETVATTATISRTTEATYRLIPFLENSIRLRAPWWYYLCLSLLDISPNYLSLLALKHTSLTSATLLGSLTVPSTMVVCYFLLRKVYKVQHYVGVILCLLGGALTMFGDKYGTDTSSSSSSSHPHSYYGDTLAVVAALIYGIGDAASEFWTKHIDRVEYLGMIGLFGSCFTFITFIIWERDAISQIFAVVHHDDDDGTTTTSTTTIDDNHHTTMMILSVMIMYVVLLVTYYVSATLFLISSDATLLNLSLQTSNLWAILFSIIVFHESPSMSFYLSVLLVISGVFVYELLGNNKK